MAALFSCSRLKGLIEMKKEEEEEVEW